MQFFWRRRTAAWVCGVVACGLLWAQPHAGKSTVLGRVEAAKFVPPTVFFRGQDASTQGRNSGGVHFADDRYMLAALVDTSGYATEVRQNYQGYLITEVGLRIDGHPLPAGSYGFGFLDQQRFIVMDIGAKKLFEAHTHALSGSRPVPLQVLATGDGYELCSGRDCVDFRR
jgi:hypothetical protein